MPSSVTIQFLGAAGTVTGSKYLVRGKSKELLIDGGMFQGSREWREKNWEEPPIDLSHIDAVLLTHAHIDHTGILPRYQRLGLKCPIYCTPATNELSQLLLPDSGRLQEEEAEYREKSGHSRHHPALPLYTEKDAEAVLKLFRNVAYDSKVNIFPGITAEWRAMGHIIGATSICLTIDGKVINFSGDVGRYGVPLLKDPEPVEFGDLLLIESTYGDKLHDDGDAALILGKIVRQTAQRGGVTLIPSFAVGRTQLILFYLRQLKEKRLIPDIPVIIDSPMARDATDLHRHNPECCSDEAVRELSGGKEPFTFSKLHFIKDRNESIKLNSISEPMVLISASGMLAGGRILHHLKHRIGDPRSTILFVGYQPPGSRGAWIKSGAQTLRLFGEEVTIRAAVREISGLSAHADRDELLRWCKSCRNTPGRVAIVHGEPESAKGFAATLKSKFGWNPVIPSYRDEMAV